MNDELIRGVFNNAVAGVACAAIIERGVFIIKTQAGKEFEITKFEGALVIGCNAIVPECEIAAEYKIARVPLNAVVGDVTVVVPLNELCDSIVKECDGGVHIAGLEKSESSGEPTVLFAHIAFGYEILGDGMLFLCLCKGEIGGGEEILVERHVVVDILVACDARKTHIVEIDSYS